MPNIEWFGWIDTSQLLSMLMLPALILVVALTIGIALNKFVTRQIRNFVNVKEATWYTIFINALRGVPVSLCLVIALYWIVNTIAIPEPLTRMFSYILFAVIVLSMTRVAARTINGVIAVKLTSADEVMPKTTLLNTILNVLIYASGVLIILQYYGISIAPIITAMGVGGMAVALALQETLANIFSGLHLILSKQLRIGDYIKLSTNQEGRVTDITWRFTTIVPTGGGNMVVVPNKTIASSTLTNFSMPKNDITISIPVGVSYDSDLEQVERVTIEVADEVLERIDHAVTEPPVVRFHTFSDSSIDFNVIMHSSIFENQFLLKHEFIKALTKRYREEGIEIPYPTRSVITENPGR